MRVATTDRNRRLRVGLALALVAGAAAFLLVKGLGDATTFFKNADEVDEAGEREAIGTKRFRLQGTVVGGSVQEVGDGVEFLVEYRCARVLVHHEGEPQELFKPGIPVVLEGRFAEQSDVYESDKMFIRHTSEYRVEEADRLALADQDAEAC